MHHCSSNAEISLHPDKLTHSRKFQQVISREFCLQIFQYIYQNSDFQTLHVQCTRWDSYK